MLLGIEGGCVVLEVLNQSSRLGSFIQDLGLALVDATAAVHGDQPWLEKIHVAAVLLSGPRARPAASARQLTWRKAVGGKIAKASSPAHMPPHNLTHCRPAHNVADPGPGFVLYHSLSSIPRAPAVCRNPGDGRAKDTCEWLSQAPFDSMWERRQGLASSRRV